MDENKIKSYIDLINIKTLNGYYKYLISGFGMMLFTSLFEFGIPTDILTKYSLLIEPSIILLNAGITSIFINKKYQKNKKEFIKNNNINPNTTVKECYEILKQEEIVTKEIPVESVISRYYIDPESYYTEKGKKLVRKR